jgi:hypothetical protein
MLLSLKKNQFVFLPICKRLFNTLYCVDSRTKRFAEIKEQRHNKLYNRVSLLVELNVLAMIESFLYRGSSVGIIYNIVCFYLLIMTAITASTKRIPSGGGRNKEIVYILNEMINLPETGN